jgi:hypothetical protein
MSRTVTFAPRIRMNADCCPPPEARQSTFLPSTPRRTDGGLTAPQYGWGGRSASPRAHAFSPSASISSIGWEGCSSRACRFSSAALSISGISSSLPSYILHRRPQSEAPTGRICRRHGACCACVFFLLGTGSDMAQACSALSCRIWSLLDLLLVCAGGSLVPSGR